MTLDFCQHDPRRHGVWKIHRETYMGGWLQSTLTEGDVIYPDRDAAQEVIDRLYTKDSWEDDYILLARPYEEVH